MLFRFVSGENVKGRIYNYRKETFLCSKYFKLSDFRNIKPLILQITLKELYFILMYLWKVIDS